MFTVSPTVSVGLGVGLGVGCALARVHAGEILVELGLCFYLGRVGS